MPENTANRSEANTRVAFDLSPAMAEEVDRIMALTDLGSKPEVFRRAFTLLRIHVEAAERGREVYMVDPDRPSEKFIITLPFNVSRRSE
jgi:hypothetical protein